MNPFHVRTEDRNFVKDMRSGAVLNIDTEGYQAFKRERSRLLRQQELEEQVSSLQQDIGDIKQLLQQLINGKTNGNSSI